MIQCGNAAEADDLAQETLLKAFKAIATFRPGTSARAWLMTILRNARIDRLRTAAGSARPVSLDARPMELAGPDVAPEPFDPDRDSPDEVLQGFSDQDVIDALQSLSEDLRWTLLLVDVEQLNQDEVAAILGVPLGTIKSRVHRGRAMLRTVLLPLARDRRLVKE